jgi:heat shock protein HslJ
VLIGPVFLDLLAALLGCVAQPPARGQTAGKGTVSMEALQGKSWVLAQLDDGSQKGSQAPAAGAIMAVFAAGQVSGSGGCNRYSASVTSPSPGALKLGPVSATKRFCLGAAGEDERRFFAALAKATHYALEDGRLVLTWDREGQSPGRLVFRWASEP